MRLVFSFRTMKSNYRTIVVKIGTNALLTKKGLLNQKTLKQLIFQIARLKKSGINIILVSSGAMGAGRSVVRPSSALNPVSQRQILAAVGQVELMFAYRNICKKLDLTTAQVLVTKEDFRSRRHYLNMQQCFQALLEESIIPIVNENDVVSVEELMFSDNDELAGLVASMIQADALIFLTSVNGVFDQVNKGKDSKLMVTIDPDKALESVRCGSKSSFGRGGMRTKLETAKRLSALGIAAHIANANTKDVLTGILKGKTAGTIIPAKQSRHSRTQHWVANSRGYRKGEVIIDVGAAKVMTAESPANLLPIGIKSCHGEFERGDIVSVYNGQKRLIGMGKASYGNKTLAKYIGEPGHQAFIRCDYFFPLEE